MERILTQQGESDGSEYPHICRSPMANTSSRWLTRFFGCNRGTVPEPETMNSGCQATLWLPREVFL